MSYLSVVSSNQALIELQLREAIILSVQEAWKRAHPNKPHEPDFVAALVTEAVPFILAYLTPLFSSNRIKVSTTGVFCHQTPKARHSKSSKSCELGDVLFVHAHRDAGGNIMRNALLLQAKVTGGSYAYDIPSKEHHQLELYRSWPDFEYVNSGASLDGKKRNVWPKAKHAGAQYLLVDDGPYFNPAVLPTVPVGHYPMAVWMAETPVYAFQPLERELLLFLSLKSGRIFYDPSKNHEWSKVVWDLLRAGMTKTFNRRRSRYVNQPRNAGDAFFFIRGSGDISHSVIVEALMDIGGEKEAVLSFLANQGDIPPDDIPDLDWHDDEVGMNLVIIETEDEVIQ